MRRSLFLRPNSSEASLTWERTWIPSACPHSAPLSPSSSTASSPGRIICCPELPFHLKKEQGVSAIHLICLSSLKATCLSQRLSVSRFIPGVKFLAANTLCLYSSINIGKLISLLFTHSQRCSSPIKGNDCVTGRWAPRVVVVFLSTVELFLEYTSDSPPPPRIVHPPTVYSGCCRRPHGRRVSHRSLLLTAVLSGD